MVICHCYYNTQWHSRIWNIWIHHYSCIILFTYHRIMNQYFTVLQRRSYSIVVYKTFAYKRYHAGVGWAYPLKNKIQADIFVINEEREKFTESKMKMEKRLNTLKWCIFMKMEHNRLHLTNRRFYDRDILRYFTITMTLNLFPPVSQACQTRGPQAANLRSATRHDIWKLKKNNCYICVHWSIVYTPTETHKLKGWYYNYNSPMSGKWFIGSVKQDLNHINFS